jgi:hypothetical protein
MVKGPFNAGPIIFPRPGVCNKLVMEDKLGLAPIELSKEEPLLSILAPELQLVTEKTAMAITIMIRILIFFICVDFKV